MSDKGSSYFNILKCGRNLLDQLNVTYQRAFTSSTKPSTATKGYYQLSPARERFYDIMSDQILEKNDGIDKVEIRKAVAHVKSNEEAEHERNIENMIQDDDYKSPRKNNDATVATTVSNALDDTGDTYLNSYDTSDSSKHVETSKEPIKDTQTI